MKREDIVATVGTIILAIVVLGSFVWIFLNADWSGTTGTKPTRRTTYMQQTPQQKTDGHCSILADKCIVDEWSLKCLWFDCIIDGRGKE